MFAYSFCLRDRIDRKVIFKKESGLLRNSILMKGNSRLKYLGEYRRVFSKESNREYLIRDYVYQSKDSFQRDFLKMSERMNVRCPSLPRLVDYCISSEVDTFHQIYKISAIFEGLDPILFDDLHQRLVTNNFYSQQALETIFTTLLTGVTFLHSTGNHHGNLSTRFITIDERSQCKILDPPRKNNMLDQFLEFRNESLSDCKTYAPEVYRRFFNRKKKIDFILAESFSLGLIILKCGLLEDLSDLYSYNNMDQELLERKIDMFSRRYNIRNGPLRYLPNLLKFNPKTRMSASDIYSNLYGNDSKRKLLKGFLHEPNNKYNNSFGYRSPFGISRPSTINSNRSFHETKKLEKAYKFIGKNVPEKYKQQIFSSRSSKDNYLRKSTFRSNALSLSYYLEKDNTKSKNDNLTNRMSSSRLSSQISNLSQSFILSSRVKDKFNDCKFYFPKKSFSINNENQQMFNRTRNWN